MKLLAHIAPIEFPVGMIGTYENGNLGSTYPALADSNVEPARQFIRTGLSMGE